MNRFINKVLKFIYSKKKQILFALFAFLCIIDSNDSDTILKCVAPVVAAGAAGTVGTAGTATAGTAVAGTTTAGTATAGTATAGTATAGSAGGAAGTAGTASTTTTAGTTTASTTTTAGGTTSSSGYFAKANTVPRNTNPNPNAISSNSVSKNDFFSKPSNLTADTSKAAKKEAAMSDVKKDKNLAKKNSLNPEFNKSKKEEEEDKLLDDASSSLTEGLDPIIFAAMVSSSPPTGVKTPLFGCLAGLVLAFMCSVAIIAILIINPSTSIMSQVDCSIQNNAYCEDETDDSGSFLNKLMNLFKYGAFASNNEVVAKKVNETYEQIKEEYDFLISLPLLTSSLFSDSEYGNSDTENGKIVLTDKMLERVEYTYDVALLQLIPKYNVFTCEAHLVDANRNIYDYVSTYQYTKTPTYKEGDTTEEDMELITTGECNAETAGGEYKVVTYFFDTERYFRRLEESEELDLVYSDYVDYDSILVNKIQNHYNLYININKIEEVSAYQDTPIQLYSDENVNLSTPLGGSIYITSPFGMREGEYAGMHTGIDLVSNDKNIYAAGDGIVTRSNVETEGGNVIEITHTDSNGVQYVTQYAHLSSRNVSVGTRVSAGDIIGIMGDTGTMASGVHLHFSMWYKEPYELINPRKLFSEATNY